MVISKKQLSLLNAGFTIVELMIATAIVATLSAIAIPVVTVNIDKASNTRAISEIRTLETDITAYETENETYPNSLSDIGRGGLKDAWGNPYEYKILTGAPGEKPRKDRFLVPVNTDYDLYSMGKDGDSKTPFTAKASRDDIVRANNGGYVGIAEEF